MNTLGDTDMKRTISVADYIVEFFIANEIKDVFGYQGGMIAYLFDSLGRYRDRINYHSCANEQGAAFAACSYAQATGNVGVAITTSGPGFTNLVTGIANAWLDSIPVIFISGNVNTKDKKRELNIRQLGFQEVQAPQIAQSITKKVFEIELTSDYKSVLDEAYDSVISNRKGPVFIDLPINVCREFVEVEEIVTNRPAHNENTLEVDELIDAINKSRRPIIIAGAGIKQAGELERFRKFVEIASIPVVSTMPAIDVLPSDSPYMVGFIGATGRREAGIALQNADFVLSVGARLCSKQLGHNMDLFAPRTKSLYRVDIDQGELSRTKKNFEKQLNYNISGFLDSVLEKEYKNENYKQWSETCYEIKQLLSSSDVSIGNRLVERITSVLNNDANVVLDVGKNMTYGAQSTVIKAQTKLFMSAGLGSMGYAIPASVGAYLGNKKQTVVIAGDGGALMTVQELNTIVKNNLPIKIIVLNNRALGNIKLFQDQYLNGRYVATDEKEGDFFSCDFVNVARAFGIDSISVSIDDNMTFIYDLLSNDKALVVEVKYQDAPVYPGIVAGGDYLDPNTGIDNQLSVKIKDLLKDD